MYSVFHHFRQIIIYVNKIVILYIKFSLCWEMIWFQKEDNWYFSLLFIFFDNKSLKLAVCASYLPNLIRKSSKTFILRVKVRNRKSDRHETTSVTFLSWTFITYKLLWLIVLYFYGHEMCTSVREEPRIDTMKCFFCDETSWTFGFKASINSFHLRNCKPVKINLFYN